jgi:hypothetical protein
LMKLVNSTATRSLPKDNMVDWCCLASPMASCHFRDKPSDLQCRNKTFEANGDFPAFW